jgi:hypothetical protein
VVEIELIRLQGVYVGGGLCRGHAPLFFVEMEKLVSCSRGDLVKHMCENARSDFIL